MAPRRAACLALLPALLWAASVVAQTRAVPIPEGSSRGYIRHVKETTVTVNGKPMRLSAGAIIRDQRNRIIVPVGIPREGTWAGYILDRNGRIARVWLLAPEEFARARKQGSGG